VSTDLSSVRRLQSDEGVITYWASDVTSAGVSSCVEILDP